MALTVIVRRAHPAVTLVHRAVKKVKSLSKSVEKNANAAQTALVVLNANVKPLISEQNYASLELLAIRHEMKTG